MLIHKMRLDDYKAVLDVNSGAVHLVDDLIYAVSYTHLTLPTNSRV